MQADLGLHCSHMHLGSFFPFEAYIEPNVNGKHRAVLRATLSCNCKKKKKKKKTQKIRAGVCKTLCSQLPGSNTAPLQHCLCMTVTTVQIYEISILFDQKGNSPKIEDKSDKKNTGHLFCHEELMYELSKH